MIKQLSAYYQSFIAQYLSLRSEWGALIDVAVVIGITALLDVVTRLVLRLLHRPGNDTRRRRWINTLYHSVNGPLQILIWVAGISLAIRLTADPNQSWRAYMAPVRGVVVTLVMVWFVFRIIASVEQMTLAQRDDSRRRLDDTSTDAIAKLVRMVVIIIAGLVLLEQVGVSPSSLLAFSGVGGIAVGFAARDVLANLFGGLTIYLNRPFSVGDWIRSPDRDIEGTVEAIGWRATTVRRFDMRPLYVPNAVFSNVSLENPSRMTHRLINETIAVRFDDAARVPDIVEAVRALLDADEAIDSNEVILTYLDSIGVSSLNLLVYCYTKNIDWAEYLALKQSVLQRVQNTIREQGGAIAMPASIIHVPDTLSVARGQTEISAQEEIDPDRVQSERRQFIEREQAGRAERAGPDQPGEQGSS